MRLIADKSAAAISARAWLDTLYHAGASVRGVGCDCLGPIRGVWREVVGTEPLQVSPYCRT